MKLPDNLQAALLERDNWESIIHSPEWVVYRRFLAEHMAYLQRQSNEHIRNKRWEEGYGSLRAMDDCKNILDNITLRLQEINKQIEKGGK